MPPELLWRLGQFRYLCIFLTLSTLLYLGTTGIKERENVLLSFLSRINIHGAPDCATELGLADKVVVAIKTGVTEATERIPIHIQHSLRCAKRSNVLVFSDVEEDIGPYHVYDALDSVRADVKQYRSDFRTYEDQYRLWQKKQNGVKDHRSRKPSPTLSPSVAGWKLDRYKNLHILEKTWRLRPDADWYIFVDADTYLFWATLMMWLKDLDPAKKSYFGSDVGTNGEHFAHGGSGIILSRAAVFELAFKNPGVADLWDPQVQLFCCGEVPFTLALEDHGILLQDTWPSMSGESPSSLPLGPSTPEYRCRPAMTMHHISNEQFKELADFEHRRKNPAVPITHAEIFRSMVLEQLPGQRDGWDNLSAKPDEFGVPGGTETAASSFEECSQICEANEACLQYSYHARHCYISTTARMGNSRNATSDGTWQSGWHLKRIRSWLDEQWPCEHISFPAQLDPPNVIRPNPFPHNRNDPAQEVSQGAKATLRS